MPTQSFKPCLLRCVFSVHCSMCVVDCFTGNHRIQLLLQGLIKLSSAVLDAHTVCMSYWAVLTHNVMLV